MTELERALERLSPHLDWSPTPAFRLAPRRRRRWLAALALAALAIAVAFAVPPARSAILRFLHVGGIAIERVDTLPPAQERSLADSLGVAITPAEARALLAQPFRTPGAVRPPLYRSGRSVSALLATPEPVLLTELRAEVDGEMLVKKLVGGLTDARYVDLGLGGPAVWISRSEHYYLAPPLPPRLAGNTLLWVRGPLTYRLEGK